jgi:subtilisin-like proprotein convertase family protein
LTIADSYSIFDVEINIAATANPNSLTLVAPDGTTANVTAGAPMHLTTFNYKDVKGTWTLRISSGDVAVSGSVTAWSLKVLGPTTAIPVPSLSIGDVSKSEGNSGTTAFSFTVTLSSASATSVTVQYATANGTATAGSDYTAAAGTLTIPAGTLSATITVPVIGDTLKETNETFSVNLSVPAGATIADGQGLGTIVNDDGKPKSAAVAAAVPVEAAGGTAARTDSGSVAGAAAAKYQQPATIAAASQPADVAVPTVNSGGQRLDVRARERDQRAVDGVFQDLDTDLLADFRVLALLP